MNHCIDRQYHNATLDCVLGDTLQIRLPCIPASGYQWQLESLLGSLSIVSQGVKSQHKDAALGSESVYYLDLQTSERGFASLHLKYFRSWIGNTSIIEQFRLQVNINGEKK